LGLDRPRYNRSQVIFTTIKGREGIFWQTPKTTRGSRPGIRVPARRASGLDDLTISVTPESVTRSALPASGSL
jgi:hypothetical protein